MKSLGTYISLFAVLFLFGCANTVSPSQMPQFHITEIDVTLNSHLQSKPITVEAAKISARRFAEAYSGEIPPGAPERKIYIRIDETHYKNPIASVVVGDANRAKARLALLDAQDQVVTRSQVTYVDVQSAAVNGIVGAMVAVGADKRKIDARLGAGIAEKAIAVSYGQKQTPKFVLDSLLGKRRSTYPPRPLSEPVASNMTPIPAS